MLCTAAMIHALKGMGFKEQGRKDSLALDIPRGDGDNTVCKILVYTTRRGPDDPMFWDMNIVYWDIDDMRQATFDVCEVKDPADVMRAVVHWSLKHGRHTMKNEIQCAINDLKRKISDIPDIATPDSLKSAREREEEWQNGKG